MSKNERQSNVSWRDAQIECAKCGEAGAVLDRVIQDSERVRLEFGCPFCGTLSVMEFVDVFHFGQIIDHHDRPTRQSFYRLEDNVVERYRKVNATYVSDVPEPEPIVAEPQPVVTRESEAEERKRKLQADQTANALEAHRKIADLVLSKQRKGLSFVERNRVIGRLSVLRGRKVWAVDPSHPAIADVINDHGGKPIIGRIWDEHKLIVVGERRNGRGQVTKLRTQDVSLGVGEPVYCYLFLAKPFEDARKGVLQTGAMF